MKFPTFCSNVARSDVKRSLLFWFEAGLLVALAPELVALTTTKRTAGNVPVSRSLEMRQVVNFEPSDLQN